MNKDKKIVAISGSIREQSSNKKIVKRLQSFLPKNIDYVISDQIKELPYFNLELDESSPPTKVKEFRANIKV